MEAVEQKSDRQFSKLNELELVVSGMLGICDLDQRVDSLLEDFNSKIEECREAAAAQKTFLEDAVLKVQRCVLDPSPATVAKWVAQPLSALWDDCQQLVDKHVATINDFSSTREGVLLETHAPLENFSGDSTVLRDSAAFVQKYKAEFSQSSMLRDSIRDLSAQSRCAWCWGSRCLPSLVGLPRRLLGTLTLLLPTVTCDPTRGVIDVVEF
ncbi:unnamed protein product [Prorocentrum cordatum]|uniref:Uncharacterized protein n=1 Tax=Prorocentrum cordatum TaxID=2364126 RepID=A0ABN9U1F7_9DINO|nr:unnamed protein product [Polarella glacialis]